MTATPQAASTSVSPDARRVWRATRAPLLILLVVLATGILLSLVRDGGGASLDPDSAAPDGSRAVARLLAAQGVRIEPQYTSDGLDPAGATLLVTRPDLVSTQTLRGLAERAGAVVLLAPNQETLDAVAPAMSAQGPLEERVREPQCALPDAEAAGAVTLGGTAYRGETTCYNGALARVGTTTVLGSHTPLTNAALADEGNAALAMRLLGGRERLVWYAPSAGDPGLRGGQESLYDLLPPGWVFGAAQVGVAAVLFALWRARRLGPVVTERLPVVVRAAETVEGRARLYRRSGATDHAGQTLRQATCERLLPLLGLTLDAEPQAVLAAIAARTGWDAAAVLYGPPPADDTTLVRLADALDELERAVRDGDQRAPIAKNTESEVAQ
ncbi:DUF4350 domain-containing protein [Saccharomonospora sp. NPDC046836]|uniref:DUF4350 domain-containing protein n=1 Tax=Saccharomonospora sp. NPDC046836 TaxID=3156921 RepID=UPI0033FB05F4